MQVIGVQTKLDDRIATRFGVLKQRLLLQRLNELPDTATHALIIRQADEAAFLAWLTSYPLLSFPCLFEERATAAAEQARRRALFYWSGLEVDASASTGTRPALPALPPRLPMRSSTPFN